MTAYQVIGTSVPRPEVAGKVTGEATYTSDVSLPGMLWGKVLHSPYSYALIVRIDTSKAEELPGVRAVLTGADVAGIRFGRGYRDVPVLAQGHVLFIGDRVAAVAADDEETALKAVDLIEVDYEELPGVFDPVEAMAPGAPILHPGVNDYFGLPTPLDEPSNAYIRNLHEKGDVEAGFAAADVVVENEFTVARAHQAYMEPHCCVAWLDDAGVMQLWAPNKNPHGLKQTVARAIGFEADNVRVNPVAVGGDFGGKGAAMEEPLCCHLAMRAGKPVKMVMEYVEELTAAAPRHAGVLRLKTGVSRDGTILAHQLLAIFDGGAYGGFRPNAPMAGAGHGAGCYRIPNAKIEVLRVYTNNLPGGQMRAPGEPQGIFAAESHLDRVAREIGMDPVEFRMKNLIVEGDETVDGTRYEGLRALETLKAAVAEAGYAAPKAANVGRGVAMAYRGPGTGESAVGVALGQDGTVVITTPVYEPGTGTYTTMRQVVAEELKYAPAQIEIKIQGTDLTPFDSGIGGSRGTRIVTGSAYQAVTDAREQLLCLAADVLEWPLDQIAVDGTDVVRADTGERRPWRDVLGIAGQDVQAHALNKDTDRAPVTAFVAQIAEVRVDPETGQVELLKFTTAHDVGTVMNPIGHQGQINGGFVQGLGYGLMEEVKVVEGRVETPSLADFKIPTIHDIPEMRTVLLEPGSGVGPYDVKGIGENPNTPVAAAIANAVEDAIGVRIRDLPVTAEKVHAALTKTKPALPS
jgi:carbon-monoxide dehydrogenase large subunit